jgi:beta-1,4-mannooligosaccharide/beta-1,4-mannosyl-N-acetylglucosamine phosphorylase
MGMVGISSQRPAATRDPMTDISVGAGPVGVDGRDRLVASVFPWQERPASCADVVWRHSGNPVIGRRPLSGVQGIYNSGVVRFADHYVAVLRLEKTDRFPRLHLGRSQNGLAWTIDPEPITFINHVTDAADYAYDPRAVNIDDTYYISWCGGHNGPTIALARTTDFESFERLENAFLPYNRNGVLFPRRIGGKYFMLSRPSDDSHTAFGDIYVSQSPDMVHWGVHRLVMRRGGEQVGQWWQRTKIGAGPIPIETPAGWLLIYHGVIDTCNGFVYSMGAALLAIDEPWRVIARCNQHVLTPEADYEVSGHVPNVVFPCAAVHDALTGRLAIYYGAADTCTCVAYAHLDELVDFVKANSCVF